MKETGICYLVATPIGNLEDITFRAIRTLKEVTVIAAEDTRNTIKLLNNYEIKTKLTSYHEHNEKTKSKYFIDILKEGKDVAIVSDAGIPAISDPGFELVKECINNNIRVSIIPGPSAFTSGLVISGLDPSSFTFIGFIATNKKKRKNQIKKLKLAKETLILYEAPHKLLNTLNELYSTLGNRKIAVVKELTKIYENVFRGNLKQAIDHYNNYKPKGEFVIIIEGNTEINNTDDWNDVSIEEHLNYYIKQGVSKKEAVKLISVDREVPKSEVYSIIMKK